MDDNTYRFLMNLAPAILFLAGALVGAIAVRLAAVTVVVVVGGGTRPEAAEG